MDEAKSHIAHPLNTSQSPSNNDDLTKHNKRHHGDMSAQHRVSQETPLR